MYRKIKVIDCKKEEDIDNVDVRDIIPPVRDNEYFEMREAGNLSGLGLYLGDYDYKEYRWAIYEDSEGAAVLIRLKDKK